MKKILFCAAHCFFKIQLVILGLFILGAFSVPSLANAQSPAPVVAIHVSELTQALETLPAVSPTPTWDGTSGYQWWYTSWHYFVAYESLKEALRSDGTPFVEVSDSDIAAGSLLNSDGSPRYPILFSLASEAIADNEIAPLIDYVSAGGFLFTGSSAFTRYPDGASRGDFALADWMAVHMTQSTLLNWYLNGYFTKSGDHRLTSHIPDGTLLWSGPASAEQIPWVTYPDFSVHGSHYAWEVVSTGATVIANGENGPLLTVKSLGQGQMIYHGTLQPLIGHGGYDPGMYAYLIYRRAIEWAFESFSMPLVKVSPWPYSYEAAFMVRHDFENDQSSIMAIKESAQFEHEHGAKGDYYFSTGALREDMLEDPVTIADIRSAVSNYGATIGSHNGGLKNPIDASLSQWDYEYWHWGPDEVLDLFPPGYENGKAYATASIQTSFLDIERWLADLDNGRPGCGSLNNCPRTWVSPFFDSTREDSCDIVEQLGSVVMGEQKISPFPHRTLSYQTKGKYFYPISLPVSDWYVDGDIAQSTEYGHSIDSIRAGVDFYYNLGFLINFYGHLPSNNGSVAQEYVTYGTSKPSLWLTNAVEVNDWWRLRATAVVTPTFAINGNTITLTASVSGSVDPATAIEIALPQISDQSISGLSVFLDETPASSDAYRITSYGIKIRVGSTVSNVRVQYSLSVSNSPPVAENDSYSVSANTTFNQAAPGVLSNDSDPEGLALTAQLVGGPAHGSLTLNADGSFIYTPITNYVGSDSFTYRAYDGTATSNLAAVTITVTSSAGVLFSDDFSRSSGASDTLAPWVSVLGTWTVENGVLHGVSSPSTYASLYMGSTPLWTDYSVEGQVQLPVGAFGGGLGGRVNPSTGARYSAWIYPDGSLGGSNVLKLVKFRDWTSWNFAPMQQVSLPTVGTAWHTLKLVFNGSRIQVYYDDTLMIDITDNGFDSRDAYLSGGVSADMWTYTDSYVMGLDNIVVRTLSSNTAPVAENDSYSTNADTPLTQAAPGILGNDSDPEGTVLTAQLVSGPSHGVLTLNSDGSFTYSPVASYVGSDSFTYQATDGTTASNVATVTITVTGVSNLPPVATDDSYSTNANTGINQAVPGILGNDSDPEGNTLTAQLVSGPSHGVLTLNSDGSFTYTPVASYVGSDSFTYQATDGTTTSNLATVTIAVISTDGVLFSDDFSRSPDASDSLAPWIRVSGTWNITNEVLQGSSASTAYASLYTSPSSPWTDYSVEGQVQLPAGAFGGGIGGRVNSSTGARYGAWIYPTGSLGGSNVLKLVKFRDWTSWNFVPMQEVSLPTVGTTWHTLKLVFNGSQIQVYYDGTLMIDITDNDFDSRAAYLSGGVSGDLWTYKRSYVMGLDNIVVKALP